jgi:septal ring factor EnvC (AmiA/AmiB activator)
LQICFLADIIWAEFYIVFGMGMLGSNEADAAMILAAIKESEAAKAKEKEELKSAIAELRSCSKMSDEIIQALLQARAEAEKKVKELEAKAQAAEERAEVAEKAAKSAKARAETLGAAKAEAQSLIAEALAAAKKAEERALAAEKLAAKAVRKARAKAAETAKEPLVREDAEDVEALIAQAQASLEVAQAQASLDETDARNGQEKPMAEANSLTKKRLMVLRMGAGCAVAGALGGVATSLVRTSLNTNAVIAIASGCAAVIAASIVMVAMESLGAIKVSAPVAQR